jgi:hypothetical protein
MDIQAEKLEIMKMILETDNPGIIESIRKILKREAKKDFWETLSQSQKDEIIQANKEIDSGEVVDYEEFISKHR